MSDNRVTPGRSSNRTDSGLLSSVVAMVLMTLLFTACGGDGDVSEPTSTSTTSATAATTSTVPSTTTTSPAGEEAIFGWLRSFQSESGVTTIGIDKAEMLTGDEALAAARKAGEIGPNEDLPNDFYISNPDESVAMFTVSPDVVVILQACFEQGECVTTVPVDLDTWSVLLGGEDDPGLPWTWYGAGGLPYVFTVSGDVVVEVAEFYLP